MTVLLVVILSVAVILAPYLLVAALTAASPRLRRGIEDIPRTDEVVARFFERTIPGAGRTYDDTAVRR
jgi:hypothetical protein